MPAEFVGDSIFTRSGGFAYLHVSSRSIFVPVTPKTVGHKDNDLYVSDQPLKLRFENVERLEPKNYDAPLHISELLERSSEAVCTSEMADKFMAAPESAVFSEGKGAALGIKFVLYDGPQDTVEKLCAAAREQGVASMQSEVAAMEGHPQWGEGYEVCKKWLDYVVLEKAVEEKIVGNDGFLAMKDTNHGGWCVCVCVCVCTMYLYIPYICA